MNRVLFWQWGNVEMIKELGSCSNREDKTIGRQQIKELTSHWTYWKYLCTQIVKPPRLWLEKCWIEWQWAGRWNCQGITMKHPEDGRWLQEEEQQVIQSDSIWLNAASFKDTMIWSKKWEQRIISPSSVPFSPSRTPRTVFLLELMDLSSSLFSPHDFQNFFFALRYSIL